VVVTQLSDLPEPVLGVITLVDNTAYRFDALVDISPNRLLAGLSTNLFSSNRLDWGIITDNAGAMITLNQFTALATTNIRLDSTGGSIYDLSNGAVLISQDVVTVNSQAVSTFDATDQCLIDNYSIFNFGTTVNGMVWTGACQELVITGGLLTNLVGTFIDLDAATFTEGIIIGPNVRMDGGAGTTKLSAVPGTIPVGKSALIHSNKWLGSGGTNLNGVTSATPRFDFQDNDIIQDSRVDGLLSLQGNVTKTPIAVAGTAVKVVGTWVIESASQMTGDTTGRVTMNSTKDAALPYTASVTVAPASGGSTSISAYAAVNGAVVAGSQRTATAASGTPTSITIPWQPTLSTNDYVEVWVANDGGTTNLLVSSAVLRVN
jgi:hypothetical protein